MKILNKFLFLFIGCAVFSACDKGDVFTGSPADTNIEKVVLTGVITTAETNVVSGQPFALTVTLPQTFDVNVLIEATSFIPNTNKRTRKTVIVPKGQTTVTFQMNSAGGDLPDLPYHLNMQVYLSSISTDPLDTQVGFPGKQYTLTSNIIDLDWGDSPLAVINKNFCSVVFDWQGPYFQTAATPYNGLSFKVLKNGVLINSLPQNSTNPTTTVYGKSNYTSRLSNINNMNILNIAGNGSTTDGTYVMEVYAQKLITSPMDVQCRFTVRFPDETAKTFYTVIPNMIIGTVANAVQKLQVIKTTVVVGGVPTPNYAVSLL